LGHEARHRSCAVADSRTEESRRKDAEQALIVWRRRDVKAVFEEGLDHRDYFLIFRNNLLQAAADYLASPWMRNAEMDWIIVDALVTGETILFGEEFKKKALAGPRDDLRIFHAKYMGSRGNLWKMKARTFEERVVHTLHHHIILPFILPAAAIFAAFHYDYPSAGKIIASLYAFLVAWSILGRIVLAIRPSLKTKSKEETWYDLWLALFAVWDMLEPPVVNPASLKKALDAATEKGVVIAQVVHGIIDDRFRMNPAIWIVRTTDRDKPPLT
jgi:hypothetical protein